MTKHFLAVDGLVEYNRKLRFHNKECGIIPNDKFKNAIKITFIFC